MTKLGDAIEWLLCRTIGCTGPLSRWFMWPYRYICVPLCNWRERRTAVSVVHVAPPLQVFSKPWSPDLDEPGNPRKEPPDVP